MECARHAQESGVSTHTSPATNVFSSKKRRAFAALSLKNICDLNEWHLELTLVGTREGP